MKRTVILALISVVAFAIFAALSPSGENNAISTNPPQEEALDLGFPDDVQTFLENTCFPCHTAEAKSAKAKLKLNFSKWADLSDTKKIKKLDKICKTIEGEDMPPKKFIDNYPDRKPTKEDAEMICKWVTEESDKLMGE